MENNKGLLPFAYSCHSFNDGNVLDPAPREKHVIDENASSMYHTRTSIPGYLSPKGEVRTKGPTLRVVPSIKRRMGESFCENDDIKRQDTNAAPENFSESFMRNTSPVHSSAVDSAPVTMIYSDPSTEATEQDYSDDIGISNSRLRSENLPSSPPQAIHPSELDISVLDYTVPRSPANRRRHTFLATSPVRVSRANTHQSSEPDFGIDRFNRFKGSFRDQYPSTDTESNTDHPPPPLMRSKSFLGAREILLRCFEDASSTVQLDGMQLTEIPDEVKDLDKMVILNPGPRQLYLSDNQISVLNPCLFKFTRVNVLSLRRNQIRYIPNCIGKLCNLIDLNIGSNQITYLPPQILDLPRLSAFKAGPNPFLEIPENAISIRPGDINDNKTLKWVSPVKILQRSRQVASLKALCLDAVGKYDVTYSETKHWKKTIPKTLQPLVAKAISKGKFQDECDTCHMIVVELYASIIEWWDILQSKDVPIKRKFCCGLCLQKYQNAMNTQSK